MSPLSHLFVNNRLWSDRQRSADPEFFSRLVRQQHPDYLWIGCSDSRVPANEIVGLAPGEVFVHRNVANVVVHTDLNCLSVLQYAIDVLEVEHVLVVGHYGCGGVRAALTDQRMGLIDNWLRHVKDVRDKHYAMLQAIRDRDARSDRLCELNVIEQVVNVCDTTVVQEAWRRGQNLTVHGLVYGLHDGILRDLGIRAANWDEMVATYVEALAALKAPASEPSA